MPSGRGQQMCRTGCLSLKSNTDRSKTILFVETPFSLNFLCFSLFTKTKLQAKIIIDLIYLFRFNNVLSATNNQVTFKQQLCSATANCASVQNGREQLLLIYNI
ncbi:hypothetical protein T09_8686 [Trichinella sp. T9]|nr:hypothetical protein T09_8686 [Trichinella sp. T9]